MSTTKEKIETTLAEPIDDILYNVAKGIVQAQQLLDQNSLATQIAIDNDEELNKYGFKAPWYHFQATDVELKFALQVEEHHSEIESNTWASRLLFKAAPLNAQYVNTYNYQMEGACTVKTKIVPIPTQINTLEEAE